MNRFIMAQVVQAERKRDLERDGPKDAKERLTMVCHAMTAATHGLIEAPYERVPLAKLAYDIAVDNLAAAYRQAACEARGERFREFSTCAC